MNKKHYAAIAEILKETKEDYEDIGVFYGVLVSKLAQYFARENEHFISDKFRAACYRKESNNEEE